MDDGNAKITSTLRTTNSEIHEKNSPDKRDEADNEQGGPRVAVQSSFKNDR